MENSARIYSIRSFSKSIDLHIAKSSSRLSQNNFQENNLLVASGKGVHVVPFDEIIRCTADGNYCQIHMACGRKIVASKTLKSIQYQLPSDQFIRVHQSHLISKSEIRFLGPTFILLRDGSRIPMSRSKKALVLRIVGAPVLGLSGAI